MKHNYQFKMPVYKKLKKICPVHEFTEGDKNNQCGLLETQDILGDYTCKKMNCLPLRVLGSVHGNYEKINYKNLRKYCPAYKVKEGKCCVLQESLECGTYGDYDVVCKKDDCPLVVILKAYYEKNQGMLIKWLCMHYSSALCDSYDKCKSYKDKCVYK